MTGKIDKICPRPAEFSLRFFKSDRLLVAPSGMQNTCANRRSLFALAIVALWPVWQWSMLRSLDASGEAWELMSLATVVFLLSRVARHDMPTRI